VRNEKKPAVICPFEHLVICIYEIIETTFLTNASEIKRIRAIEFYVAPVGRA
jgi:hypothetical protein